MARVKRGTTKLKRRRSILARAKGYRFGRSTKKRQAREALFHAGVHAFNHRRDKKGDFRRLWQIKIGGALRQGGGSFSTFIDALHKKHIALDRKILAGLAERHPDTFGRVVQKTNARS